MESLIVKTYDTSLQNYELNWVKKVSKNFNKRNIYRNPTASLYTSMVYGFAKHLPYSMDILQPEYVPADFLNMTPHDVEENNWFKWENKRTFFNSLIHWGDTFKTGMLLQMCSLFQKMLLGEFPHNFVLKEEDYIGLGIDTMTSDKEYNRCFFETLKSFPDYYQKIDITVNNEERRKVLEEMYLDMINKLTARLGSFKETDISGNTIKESKGSVPTRPYKDISMLVYWDNITFHDGIPDIIQAIKEEQLKRYNNSKLQFSNILPEDNQSLGRKLIISQDK